MLIVLQGLGFPRAPSIQIVLTLGSKVCRVYLLWAIWSPGVRACRLGFKASSRFRVAQAGAGYL